MKAILLVTDSEAMRDFERVLVGLRHQGFTVMPAIAGSGRGGLKTGDRVHPGSSSLLLTVVREDDEETLVDTLRRVRDEHGHGDVTRMWSFAADEVA